MKGDLANGIADCDKVLSMDPKNEDAKNRKARLEYQEKAANRLRRRPDGAATPDSAAGRNSDAASGRNHNLD